MQGDENLFFIKEKMEEIKIALFKADMQSVLQLPNNIISTLKVDDEGYVWFYTSCTGSYASELDKEFYAYLEYYQKGRNTRLRISGKTCIVDSCDEAFISLNGASPDSLLLLKMKIMHAEYLENEFEKHRGLMHRIKTTFTDFLSSHTARQYDFY